MMIMSISMVISHYFQHIIITFQCGFSMKMVLMTHISSPLMRQHHVGE